MNVTRHGKQLMVDGQHLADVRDERHARALQIILSWWHREDAEVTVEEASFLDEVFPPDP